MKWKKKKNEKENKTKNKDLKKIRTRLGGDRHKELGEAESQS